MLYEREVNSYRIDPKNPNTKQCPPESASAFESANCSRLSSDARPENAAAVAAVLATDREAISFSLSESSSNRWSFAADEAAGDCLALATGPEPDPGVTLALEAFDADASGVTFCVCSLVWLWPASGSGWPALIAGVCSRYTCGTEGAAGAPAGCTGFDSSVAPGEPRGNDK